MTTATAADPDECCEDTPPDRDPVLLLASGEMPEQQRRDWSPIESWRYLNPLPQRLAQFHRLRGDRIISVRLLLPPTLYHPSGSERKEKSKLIKKLPIHLQAKMNESKNHKIDEADQRVPSDLREKMSSSSKLTVVLSDGRRTVAIASRHQELELADIQVEGTARSGTDIQISFSLSGNK